MASSTSQPSKIPPPLPPRRVAPLAPSKIQQQQQQHQHQQYLHRSSHSQSNPPNPTNNNPTMSFNQLTPQNGFKHSNISSLDHFDHQPLYPSPATPGRLSNHNYDTHKPSILSNELYMPPNNNHNFTTLAEIFSAPTYSNPDSAFSPRTSASAASPSNYYQSPTPRLNQHNFFTQPSRYSSHTTQTQTHTNNHANVSNIYCNSQHYQTVNHNNVDSPALNDDTSLSISAAPIHSSKDDRPLPPGHRIYPPPNQQPNSAPTLNASRRFSRSVNSQSRMDQINETRQQHEKKQKRSEKCCAIM